MKLIYDIFSKLRKQEKRQIKQTIKNSAFAFNKVGKLYDLVTQFEEREEKFYSQRLYDKDPDNTFRVTKSRLKRMMENVLLNDKSLQGYGAESINARLQTKKRLLQGEILLGRGAYQAGKNLLHHVISTARKFSLYQEQFQAELLLYRNLNIRTTTTEYSKQTQSLLEINRNNALINEGLILQYSLSNLLLNRTLQTAELKEVEHQINRIRQIAEETGHPLVRHGCMLTENYFFQITGQLEEAQGICRLHLELLKNELSLSTPQRIAGTTVQLAKITLQLGKLEEARTYTDAILDLYAAEEMNYLVGLELSFRLEYERGNYEAALEQVEEANQHPQFQASSLLEAKWHYFEACVQFQRGDFRSAIQKLNQTSPLLTDKVGINLHIRLLEIILLYELGHIDLIENKVMNMRQYVKRTHNQEESKRSLSQIKSLVAWYRNNYDFEMALDNHLSKNPQMVEAARKRVVDTSDLELVKLEEWFEEKGRKEIEN